MNERRRSIVISVVRFVVRLFIDLQDRRIVADLFRLGEGWGEGLANTTNHPLFSSTLRALTLALSHREREKKTCLTDRFLAHWLIVATYRWLALQCRC